MTWKIKSILIRYFHNNTVWTKEWKKANFQGLVVRFANRLLWLGYIMIKFPYLSFMLRYITGRNFVPGLCFPFLSISIQNKYTILLNIYLTKFVDNILNSYIAINILRTIRLKVLQRVIVNELHRFSIQWQTWKYYWIKNL